MFLLLLKQYFILKLVRKLEKYIRFPIPKAKAYFFSYPTIFRFYLEKNPKKFIDNSLILYPHNEPEMGSVFEQVELLNKAHKVYFYCKYRFCNF